LYEGSLEYDSYEESSVGAGVKVGSVEYWYGSCVKRWEVYDGSGE
jgi:hypothetical protein